MGTEAVRFLVLWMGGWVNSRQDGDGESELGMHAAVPPRWTTSATKSAATMATASVERHERLGGLLNFYYRRVVGFRQLGAATAAFD